MLFCIRTGAQRTCRQQKTNTTKALPVAVAAPVVEEERGSEPNVDLLVDDPSEFTILVVDDEPINR